MKTWVFAIPNHSQLTVYQEIPSKNPLPAALGHLGASRITRQAL
jgi:hypothetical protein